MKKLLFILSTAAILASCSSKKDPQLVAEEYYNLINQHDFEVAKKLCTPSAVEFIEGMQKSFANIQDSIQFQTIDVIKKESPVEGDTAIVSYKIGNLKDQFYLVFTEGQYKVVYTYKFKVPQKVLLKKENNLHYIIGVNNDTVIFTGVSVDSISEKKEKFIIETPYIKGMSNGLMTHYYLDGKIRYTKEIKNGQVNGMLVFYYKSGQKECEGLHINGEREGKWT